MCPAPASGTGYGGPRKGGAEKRREPESSLLEARRASPRAPCYQGGRTGPCGGIKSLAGPSLWTTHTWQRAQSGVRVCGGGEVHPPTGQNRPRPLSKMLVPELSPETYPVTVSRDMSSVTQVLNKFPQNVLGLRRGGWMESLEQSREGSRKIFLLWVNFKYYPSSRYYILAVNTLIWQMFTAHLLHARPYSA